VTPSSLRQAHAEHNQADEAYENTGLGVGEGQFILVLSVFIFSKVREIALQ